MLDEAPALDEMTGGGRAGRWHDRPVGQAPWPEYLTVLLFLAAAMILRVAPADVLFAGFLSSAFWLILSGFVLGGAVSFIVLAPLDFLWLRLLGLLPRCQNFSDSG